ncbi:MAG TPA: GNAT family N-acetyltransferase [Propionibacteriaceae bacterium]
MPPVLPLVASHLTGPHLVLDPLVEADAAELGRVLMQPELYAHGYVMHHRPLDADDALAMARGFVHASVPTGSGQGRTPYAIRLGVDTDLAPAGTFVGTSSLGDFHTERESAHLGWTLYDSRFWSTYVNPEAKLLLLTHAFEDLGYGRSRSRPTSSTPVARQRSRNWAPPAKAYSAATSPAKTARGATPWSSPSRSTTGPA